MSTPATLAAKSALTSATVGFDAPAGPQQFAAGDRIGRYEIVSFLGRGGMGEVYRGHDPLIDRDAAIKILPASLAENHDALQRFLAEARAVGRLAHPNTVALYEVGQQGAGYYLAMEFVAGGAVADLVDKEGALEWRRATRLMIDVASGLTAAHAVGLVHRDIKPENLLRSADDRVKITDFGLAKAFDSVGQSTLNLTRPGDLLGTPYYMSPEQFSGLGVDHRSDLYSAGGTYYALLTGRRPYDQSSNVLQVMYAHCNSPAPDPRSVVATLPAGCAAVVAKAMAKEPGERYATAADLVSALAELLATAPEVQAPAKPEVWLAEPSRLQAKIVAGLLAEAGAGAVRAFTTSADLIAALPGGAPAVLLAAVNLADAGGDELIERVKGLPGGRGVACFLMSSDHAGPTASHPGRPPVIAKPVTRESLAEALALARR